MITKTFICDSCKNSVGESELTTLKITMEMQPSANKYRRTISASKDVCKNCLEKRGILTSPPEGSSNEETEAKNIKTMQDKLIDVLEDLGVAFCE